DKYPHVCYPLDEGFSEEHSQARPRQGLQVSIAPISAFAAFHLPTFDRLQFEGSGHGLSQRQMGNPLLRTALRDPLRGLAPEARECSGDWNWRVRGPRAGRRVGADVADLLPQGKDIWHRHLR